MLIGEMCAGFEMAEVVATQIQLMMLMIGSFAVVRTYDSAMAQTAFKELAFPMVPNDSFVEWGLTLMMAMNFSTPAASQDHFGHFSR